MHYLMHDLASLMMCFYLMSCHSTCLMACLIYYLILHVSGVMFTSDPVTENSSYIIIDANYGLGEVWLELLLILERKKI